MSSPVGGVSNGEDNTEVSNLLIPLILVFFCGVRSCVVLRVAVTSSNLTLSGLCRGSWRAVKCNAFLLTISLDSKLEGNGNLSNRLG